MIGQKKFKRRACQSQSELPSCVYHHPFLHGLSAGCDRFRPTLDLHKAETARGSGLLLFPNGTEIGNVDAVVQGSVKDLLSLSGFNVLAINGKGYGLHRSREGGRKGRPYFFQVGFRPLTFNLQPPTKSLGFWHLIGRRDLNHCVILRWTGHHAGIAFHAFLLINDFDSSFWIRGDCLDRTGPNAGIASPRTLVRENVIGNELSLIHI